MSLAKRFGQFSVILAFTDRLMFNHNSNYNLEREFELAKDQGRWLSDDERKAFEQRREIRSKLILLTGICIILPPLWPFAFGLTLYLLFPKTISRIGVVAIVVFLLGSLVVTGILIFLFWGLFNAFF